MCAPPTMAHSAGIILFNDEAVLLGLQKSGWSSFGGRSNVGETPVQTAAREAVEETRGILCCDEIEARIGRIKAITSPTPKGQTFYLFCVRHPVDERIVSKIRATRTENLPLCMKETRDVRWIRWEELDQYHLRRSFRQQLPRMKRWLKREMSHARQFGNEQKKGACVDDSSSDIRLESPCTRHVGAD